MCADLRPMRLPRRSSSSQEQPRSPGRECNGGNANLMEIADFGGANMPKFPRRASGLPANERTPSRRRRRKPRLLDAYRRTLCSIGTIAPSTVFLQLSYGPRCSRFKATISAELPLIVDNFFQGGLGSPVERGASQFQSHSKEISNVQHSDTFLTVATKSTLQSRVEAGKRFCRRPKAILAETAHLLCVVVLYYQLTTSSAIAATDTKTGTNGTNGTQRRRRQSGCQWWDRRRRTRCCGQCDND